MRGGSPNRGVGREERRMEEDAGLRVDTERGKPSEGLSGNRCADVQMCRCAADGKQLYPSRQVAVGLMIRPWRALQCMSSSPRPRSTVHGPRATVHTDCGSKVSINWHSCHSDGRRRTWQTSMRKRQARLPGCRTHQRYAIELVVKMEERREYQPQIPTFEAPALVRT